MKRSLALALCLCLALSLMTVAFAADVGKFSDKATASGATMSDTFGDTHRYIITEDASGLLAAETTWTVGGGTVTYTPNGNDYTLTITNVKESGLSICLNTASGDSDITVDVEGECIIRELISNDADGDATVTLTGNLAVSAIQAHHATATKSFTVGESAKLTISSNQASDIDNLTLNPYSQMTTAGRATVTIEKYFKGNGIFEDWGDYTAGSGAQLTVGEGTTLTFDNGAFLDMSGPLTVNGTFEVKDNKIDSTNLTGGGDVKIGPNGKVFNEECIDENYSDKKMVQYVYVGGTVLFVSTNGGKITVDNVEYTLSGDYTNLLENGVVDVEGMGEKTIYLAGAGFIRHNGSAVILDGAALTHPLALPDRVTELHLVHDTTSTITVAGDTATALSASGSLTIKSTEDGHLPGVLRIISPNDSPNTGIHVTGGLTIDDANVTVGYYSNLPGVAQNINPAYAVKAASLTVTNNAGLSAYATEQCIDIEGTITVSNRSSINAHHAPPHDQTAATIQAQSLTVKSGDTENSGSHVRAYWGGLEVTDTVQVTGAGSFISASNEEGTAIVAATVSVTGGAYMERVKGTTGIEAETVTIESTRGADGTLNLIWGTTGPAIKATEATLGAENKTVVVAGTPAGVVADKVTVKGELSADENITFTGTYTDGVGKGVAVKSDNVIIEGGYINFTPTITLEYTEHACTGGELRPGVTVKDGERVIDPRYYTVSYENNIHNLNNQPAKVTVTATNGYWFDPIGEPAKETEIEDNVNTPYTLEFKITGTPPAGGNNGGGGTGGGNGVTVKSPDTFDAGIALYAGLALSAALGAAYVGKKFSLDK